MSNSVLNSAIDEVRGLINAMGNFAEIKRGALGIDAGLTCEPAPSMVDAVFMDKNSYIPLTLALNGKHENLKTLSDTLNNIIDTLTRRTSYPDGDGFEIVDITSGNLPRVIGRDDKNQWIMAGDLVVKIYRKDNDET